MVLDEDSDEKRNDSLRDWQTMLSNAVEKGAPNL